MAIKGWADGHCPLCGFPNADIVYPAIHERFDEAAVLCACQGKNDRGNLMVTKLRMNDFWDMRLSHV